MTKERTRRDTSDPQLALSINSSTTKLAPVESSYPDEKNPSTRKRAPRGTYRNRAEAARAWRERNKEKFRMTLRLGKYTRLKYAAKRRGIAFTLTRDEFISVRNGANCHYCGGPLPDYGHGIDRKDSSHGYTPENVAPCCQICNVAKGDQLTYSEMLELGAAIARIRARRLEAKTRT
jgi:5-methylcytosine-specific restriction endonuclease McrA